MTDQAQNWQRKAAQLAEQMRDALGGPEAGRLLVAASALAMEADTPAEIARRLRYAADALEKKQ